MPERLSGKSVAILATDGVEQSELIQPRQALQEAGAKMDVISLKPGQIRAWNRGDWGEEIQVDKTLDEVNPGDYDALLLPGGVKSPDRLRMDENAVQFVKSFFMANKPVAAICHAPWMLVEADVVDGRTLTSYPSLETDIKNAGGHWVDREVVVDQGLVTSRRPDDIPAFNQKMIEEFAEGKHQRRGNMAGSASSQR